jgi:hypothetical protein
VPAIVKSGCAKNPISQIQSSLSLLSSRAHENISLKPSGKSPLEARAIPHPRRGAYRDRHGRWARDAMDALAAR